MFGNSLYYEIHDLLYYLYMNRKMTSVFLWLMTFSYVLWRQVTWNDAQWRPPQSFSRYHCTVIKHLTKSSFTMSVFYNEADRELSFRNSILTTKKEKWTKPIDLSDVSEDSLKGGRGNKIVFQTNRPYLSPHRDVVRPQSTIHQHLHKSIVARNSNDDMQIAFFIKTPETIRKSIT